MTDKVTILLADDHAVLRSGLRLLIDSQPDLQVVGEADSGLTALARARELRPNLILLDLSMAGLDGLTILPTLRQELPETRVIVLTMYDDSNYLQEALRGGASGYVLKKAVDSELLMAIRAVMRGETYIHSPMTAKLLHEIMGDSTPTTPQNDNPWAVLSEREFGVLRLVALGYTNAEIASELYLSVKTVETYRTRGMEKLGLQTRAQLVKLALEHGILN